MANWTTKPPEEDGVYYWIGIVKESEELFTPHGPYIAEVKGGKLPWMGEPDMSREQQDYYQVTDNTLVAFFNDKLIQPELPEERELQKLWDRQQEN